MPRLTNSMGNAVATPVATQLADASG